MIEIDQGEQIVAVVRKHWFVLLANIVALLIMVSIPILLLIAEPFLPVDRIFAFSANPFYAKGYFLFLWLLLTWMVGWYLWTNYYLDVLLITDKHIYDIEQYGFFRRRSGVFRIDRIQNVSIEVKGVIQTLLNFGTMRIETAGEREDFVAPLIARPYEVKQLISKMQDEFAERPQETRVGPPPIDAPSAAHSSEKLRADSEGI
jgi:uncharacterized membrane protein YdbT with pleckstrin-like domain